MRGCFVLSQFPGQSQGRIPDIADPDLTVTCTADDVVAIDAKFAVKDIRGVTRVVLVPELVLLPVPDRDLQVI